MNLTIRAIGFPLTPALRNRVSHRIHRALHRFTPRLGEIHVKLSDVNGPRGGDDKRCRIDASLLGARDITIDETHSDMYAAIDRASNRAAHATARSFHRGHSRSRRTQSFQHVATPSVQIPPRN